MTTESKNGPSSALSVAPGWAIKRDAAREAWIKRFTGYFGDPLRLGEYRRGEITFRELYDSTMRHADDMVNEAGRYDAAADPHDDFPNGRRPSSPNVRNEPRALAAG